MSQRRSPSKEPVAGATHRRQHVEQRHVIRNDRDHVHDVLEVAPQLELLIGTLHSLLVSAFQPNLATNRSLVVEVAPEPEFRRTRDETQDRLDGEPGRSVYHTLRPGRPRT